MAFRVEYSAQAEQDLDAILEWLLEQEAGGKRPALVSKN
jgi:plasmid stabilization system protein ParE